MKASQINLKKHLIKLTFALIVVSLLVSLASVSFAMAQDDTTGQEPVISCNPSSGPPGGACTVIGMGWPSNTQVSVTMQSATTSGFVSQMFGRFTCYFTIPNLAAGQYTVTATGAGGETATSTFTVTAATPKPTTTVKPTSGTTPKPSGAVTPGPSTSGSSHPQVTDYPSYTYNPYNPYGTQPPTVEEAGFPVMEAGVIVVVIAVVIVVSVLLLRRRGGKPEPLSSEEEPLYRPGAGPSNPPRYPGPGYGQGGIGQAPPRYGQSSYGQQLSRPPVTSSRYGQSSAYGQQFSRPTAARPTSYGSSPYGRSGGYTQNICPNCKRVVKEGYNRCPYCDKRLR